MHMIDWQGKKRKKKFQFQFFSFAEIGNFNIGGPVNQLIKKKGLILNSSNCQSGHSLC
jgi:hypothetical protein